jgi:PQQ-like domain
MRHLALLLTAAAAIADDGGIAPDTRWSHARGPASCSGQSLAQPPETFGGLAWTYKAKGAVLFPPVVWDGAIFLVDGDAKAAELVALDAETGKPWARAAVRAPGQPAVSSRSAFLVEEGKTLVQIHLDGRALSRQWSYAAGAGASPPRIVDGEIYVATPGALLSLRAGMSRPAWKVEGAFAGEPAVRDGHVYALRRDGTKLLLSAYARADGKEASSVTLADPAEAGAGGRVVIGNRVVGALLPPEKAQTWAVLGRNPGTAELSLSRTEKLLTEPFVGDRLLLALSPDRVWTMYYADDKNPRIPRVTAADRPELFEAPAAAIWLGESCQVFGDWCGDMIGNAVFWHARERPEGAPLRKGLRFHAVPARDELLLLVPADGKTMLALVPEEIG